MTIDVLRKRAIYRGGIYFYNVEDSMLLVKLCKEAGVPILGIDAFILTLGKTQPSMENSIDLSDEKESHNKAMNFLIARRHLNFVYEIVY